MKDLYKIMLTNVCYSTDLQCESLCIHGRSRTPVPTIKIQFTLVNPNLSYKLTKKVNAVALAIYLPCRMHPKKLLPHKAKGVFPYFKIFGSVGSIRCKPNPFTISIATRISKSRAVADGSCESDPSITSFPTSAAICQKSILG